MKYRYKMALFLASGAAIGVALAHYANAQDSLEDVRRDLTTNVRQVNVHEQRITSHEGDIRQNKIDIRILEENTVSWRREMGQWKEDMDDLDGWVTDKFQEIERLPVVEQGEAIAAVRESAGMNADAVALMKSTLSTVESDIGNMGIFNPDDPPTEERVQGWRTGVEDGSAPLAQRVYLNQMDVDTNAQNIGVLDRRTLGQAETLQLMDTTLVRLDEGVKLNTEGVKANMEMASANAEGVAANLQTLGEHDERITVNTEGVAMNSASIGDMGILDRREVENEDGEMVAAVAFDAEQRAALQESYDQGTADIATNLYVNRERLDTHDALINTNIENIGILDDRTLAHGETLKSHSATLKKHGQRLDAVEDGVSMAMALSSLDTKPGVGENFRVGAGVGMAGSAALAVGGTGRIAKHGAWNLGVSTTGVALGGRVGLSWGF